MRSLQLATALGNEATDPLDAAELLEADAHDAMARAIRARVVARAQIRQTAAPPVSAQPLHTRQQLAAALGCSLATVDRECKTGAIPFVIVGDSRRFDLQQVRAALAARTEAPAPPPRDLPTPEAASAPSGGVRRVSVGGSRRGSR